MLERLEPLDGRRQLRRVSPTAQIATVQEHVPGRDAVLARVCVRDADEASPARARVGRERRSLDVDVDGVAWVLAGHGVQAPQRSSCAARFKYSRYTARQGCSSP